MANELQATLDQITPLSAEWLQAAQARLDDLTKPRGSLGQLEVLAQRYVAIREESGPGITGKRVLVCVSDHEVVAEGVSAYPAEVTGLMVQNFLAGGAAINVLARQAGAKVQVVDVGMKDDLGDVPGLLRRNVRRGAGNIARGPAMSVDEARRAVEVGIELARQAAAEGVSLLGTGDMGIGNTTPSSALYAALLPCDPADVTGPGTGLPADQLPGKTATIRRALATNRERLNDPLSTLAAVGGLEIAAIAGICLGGAASRVAVVVDGFISGAGALVAMRLCPTASHYLFFSHRSAEPGHRAFFERERLRPVLDLDMRLGEGTGAALAMQLIESAVAVYREMATFSQVGITPGA
ncbi:MAG: nicotinate-nucleotide--dimethylbenzimidazole phosphoribosyltransferase [Armatimonadetes bacterium CG_4_10_14_3_um_filter_66_18]|nr:nicotinate-nucleotide--dimethylbenzimidazole phosphoribosyltransferase [Armatimonadota bacterium]OIP10147.1 MAG: nicotinate-nucleotide--dimethylbenzimidazole phosphoribosyltransferase [Armatimonadetes bacterium CG2_30_66_41]PIU93168.1 MAG: nicotinate-nucleotide--dimethylbenzimidazole phosphoribosyltransferase [Armatimonadetes bacterium CG06_land_8_20_14_3_00_66_21]PIX49812.1 MAG: nicotinate-nucleotide--dimethylbenzimidazole phosphoribosyltransferase [Armatimonadetes bacterium CG_4_8_14_3_um_f